MPHHEHVYFKNIKIPSVNDITGCLSKAGLERWWRKIGFEEADKQTSIAKNRGSEVGKLFEDILKGHDPFIPPHYQKFVDNWLEWKEKTVSKVLAVEPHLLNREYLYHGSPDIVIINKNGEIELPDYKVKPKEADYGILMNEAAYSACGEIISDNYTKFTPVPWEYPAKVIRVVIFHPETANIYEKVYENDPQYFQDFLTCKTMLEVNQKASKYYNTHCRKKLAE